MDKWVIAGLCLVVVVVLRRFIEVPRQSQRTLEFAWLTAICCWSIVLELGTGTFLPSLAVPRALQNYAPLCALAFVVLAQRSRLYGSITVPPATLPVLGILVLGLAGLSWGGGVGGLPLLMAISAPALLGPSSIKMVDVQHAARVALVFIVIATAAAVLVAPTAALLPCRASDYCLLGTTNISLAGVGKANILGLHLAILLPWVVYRLPRVPQMLVIAAVGSLALYAGGRSSLIPVAFLAALAATAWRTGLLRRVLFSLYFLGATSSSLVPVVRTYPSSAATSRGALWARAKQLIAEAPIAGHGSSYWVRQGVIAMQQIPANYSAHNIWLEIAVAGGIVGLLLYIAFLVLILNGATGNDRTLLASAVMVTIAGSVFEAPLQIHRLGVAPLTMVLLALGGLVSRQSRNGTSRSGSSPPETTRSLLAPEQDGMSWPRTGR